MGRAAAEATRSSAAATALPLPDSDGGFPSLPSPPLSDPATSWGGPAAAAGWHGELVARAAPFPSLSLSKPSWWHSSWWWWSEGRAAAGRAGGSQFFFTLKIFSHAGRFSCLQKSLISAGVWMQAEVMAACKNMFWPLSRRDPL